MGSHITSENGAQPPPQQIVLDAIRRIVQALRESAVRAERDTGLSAAQLFVLSRLGQGPAVSVNELAGRTFTHQSSTSVVAAKLAKQGLVGRARSAKDGRQVMLSLTSRGKQLLERAPDIAQERLLDGLGAMASADVRQLARLLGRFVEAMGIDAQPPRLFFEDSPSSRGRKASRKGGR